MQRLRIDAEELILVGAIGQLRLVAARGDALQLGRLLLGCDRLVAVLDGPVVVGAERQLPRVRGGVAGAGQVDRRVLHHRAGESVLVREFGVGQLRFGVDARAAEVVAQAQRVADLVDRGVGEVVEHPLLGLGARRVEVAARLEHVHRIGQLLGGHVGVLALIGVVAGTRSAARRELGHPLGRARLHQRRPVHRHPRREHLRAQRAHVARRQALEADVGIEDLPGARVDLAGPDGTERRRRVGHPADRRHADVERVEIGIVGLRLDDDRVLEADALEGVVPHQDALGDGVAVLQRDRAIEPEGDRLDRLRQGSARVLLLQAPAIDLMAARRARQIVAEVLHHGVEVTDARIRPARPHRLLRQHGQRVVHAEEQAAHVGQRVRVSSAPAPAGRRAPAGQCRRWRSAPRPRTPPDRACRAPP